MGGFEYFFDPNKRVFWLYIISSLLLGSFWVWFHPKQKRVLFSSALWLHPSAKLDYLFFIVSFFIKILLIFPLILSAKTVAFTVVKILLDLFGFANPTSMSYSNILILFTCSLFIVSDFTRYWLHRLLHTIPFLWEIHKVHHSAKVLTPITFYRVHPIENLLFGLRYALSIGAVTGVFLYFFGAKIGLVEVYGVNIFVFIFSLAGANLRHSHVALSYPTWCEKWLISPKQHQMHHSIKFTHKNYGGYLAVWDDIFGTLAISHKVKYLKFGLKRREQMALYENLWGLLFTPFLSFKRRVI